MAGSYKHATTKLGNLRSNESFVLMIQNLGDAYEMAEEMFGMIWYLAVGRGEDPAAEVEEARLHYREGLQYARDANRELRTILACLEPT